MNVKNFLFLVITILLLEVFCQIALIIFGDNKFSILFKPLSNQISKFQTDYLINWDYENNKMKGAQKYRLVLLKLTVDHYHYHNYSIHQI